MTAAFKSAVSVVFSGTFSTFSCGLLASYPINKKVKKKTVPVLRAVSLLSFRPGYFTFEIDKI